MELRAIGKVKHGYTDDEVRDRAGKLDGRIEIFPEYAEGLSNLEKFSHIFVIAIMHGHLNEEFPLKIRPRLLLRKGYRLEDLPEIGVFSSDSPSRPNPIGLSLLKLIRIEGSTIFVSGLDLFNETPVADIKPYSKRYMAFEGYETNDAGEECGADADR